jgi:hypothetical protein
VAFKELRSYWILTRGDNWEISYDYLYDRQEHTFALRSHILGNGIVAAMAKNHVIHPFTFRSAPLKKQQ